MYFPLLWALTYTSKSNNSFPIVLTLKNIFLFVKASVWLSGTYGFMTYCGACRFSACCLLNLLYIKTHQAVLWVVYQVWVYKWSNALFIFFVLKCFTGLSNTKHQQIELNILSLLLEGLSVFCNGAFAGLSVNGLIYLVRKSTLYHTDLVTVFIFLPQAKWTTAWILLTPVKCFTRSQQYLNKCRFCPL